jgi:hypothetical protein
MNKLLLGFAVVPFLAETALAAESLSDAQMDRVTAGASCSGVGCTSSTSTGSGLPITTTTSTSTGGFVINPADITNLPAVLQSFYAWLSANGYSPQP